MSEETSTLEQGGGEVLPQQQKPVQPAYVDNTQDDADPKPAPEVDAGTDDGKKRNKTREYIERLQSENREVHGLRQKLQELESRLPKAPEPKEPKLEDFDFDTAAYARAAARWDAQQDQVEQRKAEAAQAEQRTQQEAITAYQQRAAAFAETVEDFIPVVMSIPKELMPPELEAALMAHEKGPELAYKLAQDEEQLFSLAAMRPELMARAVERFASRLSDAPKGEPAPPEVPALAQAPQKPITQAPAPAPRVGGRAATEVPGDKLTDDEWFKRERDQQRRG